jgi:hypothetical protein
MIVYRPDDIEISRDITGETCVAGTFCCAVVVSAAQANLGGGSWYVFDPLAGNGHLTYGRRVAQASNKEAAIKLATELVAAAELTPYEERNRIR